jgi:Concanavalin A-like lectin/glucanases superfamily/Putative amidase domain
MVRDALVRLGATKIVAASVAVLVLTTAMVLIARPLVASADPGTSQGPVAAYSFDEGVEAGSTVEDVSGDGHEGTIEGATRTEHGKYGEALEFNGESDCVSVPSSEALALEEEFTLEAWVKPQGPLSEDPVIYKESEGGVGYALGIALVHGGKAEGFGGEAENVISPEVMEAGVWSHLAVTDDGAHLRLYVDGALIATRAVTGEVPIGPGPLYIGCDGSFGQHFHGRIDEARIYGRALSGPEVAADMEAPLQTPKQGPVAAYSFDEGSEAGTTVEDVTGDGHEGTIEGATRTEHGKYGGALGFAGKAGECVTVPSSPELGLGEEFTVEAWAKSAELVGEPIVFKESEGFYSYILGISLGEGGRAEGWVSDGEGEWEVHSAGSLEANVWTHIALTYDGAHLRLYVDGEQVATKAVSGLKLSSEGPLDIGCAPPYHETFHGKIDEVRLYERALSGPEVAADMEAPLQTPRQGPVAAYSFDEGSEETVEDLSGDENEGTVEDAKSVKGRYGDALEFNGATSCVSIPNSESLQLGEEFTIETWVRPEGSFTEEPIIFKEKEGGPGYVLGIGIGASGRPEGFAEFEEITAPEPIQRNVWTHLAYTYDGNHMRLYVDGALAANKLVGSETLESEGPLQIGCWAGHEHFEGRIDEVRIYDRAITGPEVDADMEAPIQTPKQGPVAEYSFDEGVEAGPTVEDVTGDGHEGTIEGATRTEHGRYGGAMEFNGEDSCVSVESDAELQMTEEFTLEAWVRPESEGLDAIITQEDETAGEEEDPFAFSFLSGDEEHEGPRLWIRGSEGGPRAGVGGEPIPEDAWSHLAVTDDGAHLRFYVDGELQGTTAAIPVTTAHGPLTIGCLALYGNHFKGRIDEVRIYNRAITGPEVDADMEAPIQTPKQGPVAEYSFDEGVEAGPTVEDVTGDGHEGTIEGATRTEHGKYGGALNFAGKAGECVTVASSPELGLGEEFTIEAWVKSAELVGEPIVFKESEGFYSYILGISLGEDGRAEGWVSDGEGEWEVHSAGSLEANVWTHLALTYDGAHLRLYVDGEQAATKAVSGLKLSSEGPLDIGCAPPYHETFHGRIDEVRIYNRALSSAEAEPDVLPPTAPTDFSAMLETESLATVSWNWSTDPSSSRGAPGSGVAAYLYRFRKPGYEWSPWESSEVPAFQVEGASEGEVIHVLAFARDNAGNDSPVVSRDLTVIESPYTPEELGTPTGGQGPYDVSPEPSSNEEEVSESRLPNANSFDVHPFSDDPEDEELCAGTGENPCHRYNGFRASTYAQEWSLNGQTDAEARVNHNHKFRYFGGEGGDCTNFVSQSLHAGGMLYMRASGLDSPDAYEGENNVSAYHHGQGAWWSIYENQEFLKPGEINYDYTRAWAGADGLYEHLAEYHLGHILDPDEHVERGDIVFWSEEEDLSTKYIHHSQIVTKINGEGVWVAQHSINYEELLPNVLERVELKEHRLRGRDFEIYFFKPVYGAANIG